MALDISKLENVKESYGKTIARCPACAEMGKDNKGEHLFINSDGRFGCVAFPLDAGKEHRSRIYQLVGVREYTNHIDVNKVVVTKPKTLIPNVLGRLGQQNLTSIQNNIINPTNNTENLTESKTDVPSVPDTKTIIRECLTKGILLTAYNGELHIETDKIPVNDSLKAQILEKKEQIIEFLENTQDFYEDYIERASIKEFEAGFTREEAEKHAFIETLMLRNSY